MYRESSPVLGKEANHEELKHFKDKTNDDRLLDAQLSHENRHQGRLQTVHRMHQCSSKTITLHFKLFYILNYFTFKLHLNYFTLDYTTKLQIERKTRLQHFK